MKNGKAAGEDRVAVEFLRGLPEMGLTLMRRVLNDLWINEEIVRGWETGRIHPIHKAGDANTNYRGSRC